MRRLVAGLFVALAACSNVDDTEHCIETRYGRVIDAHVSSGPELHIMTELTCFTTTEMNFPEDRDEVETIQNAQTSDPVTVSGDFGFTFEWNEEMIPEIFAEKRTERAAITEVYNAAREAYRTALNGWSINQIFSNRRVEFGDSIKAHIQRKLGGRITVNQVFARDIRAPESIETARTAAARQAQVLDSINKQFVIDSVQSYTTLMQERNRAEATRLNAQALASSPQQVEIEVAERLARICQGVTTCIIGGSVADTWRLGGGR